MGLLDTEVRAQEFLNLNLDDVEMTTGAVLIRQINGRKPRKVLSGYKIIRSIQEE